MWDEPDGTSPQLIITQPNGNWHYLVDPETYWAKRRQRSEWLYKQNNLNLRATKASMVSSPSNMGTSSPKDRDLKRSKIFNGGIVQKWKECGSPRRGGGIIPLPKSLQAKRHNPVRSEEVEGIANPKSFSFFSTMRTIAWGW